MPRSMANLPDQQEADLPAQGVQSVGIRLPLIQTAEEHYVPEKKFSGRYDHKKMEQGYSSVE